MRILFLDDMEQRHEHAREWFGEGREIVSARTAPECLGMVDGQDTASAGDGEAPW